MDIVIKEEIDIKEEFEDDEYYDTKAFPTQTPIKTEVKENEDAFQSQYNKEDNNTSQNEAKELYECKYCSKKFERLEYFRYHMNIHLKNYVYCDFCKRKYAWKSSLRIHMAKHLGIKINNTKRKGHYPCLVCGKIYSIKHDMVIHSIIHTNEKPYKCNDCDKQYFRKSSLKRHKRNHLRATYFCKNCGRYFTRKYMLDTHICKVVRRTHHKYECDYCKKLFKTKKMILLHILNWHIAVKNNLFYCSVCFEVLINYSDVKLHKCQSKCNIRSLVLNVQDQKKVSEFNLFKYNDMKIMRTPIVLLTKISVQQ